ncbi:MAG: pyruvate kinase [Xanthomonadales bacterium]|nr:pyruvate kinase [Xanthomonadales bacterium]NIN58439.1 pyruvate kinase [Xanthomonadales bacterium]NIN74985.1 pyruvate kinase [Xanthomonadales bacterium]NIO13077.1 pyruvate kinase [Xanthomonadales bacterium]NIP10832.1 pyruvate kinase [Xanthomonadales bacterium]
MQNRRTKIIATLGPATDERAVLARVIEAGADVLRINLSHGSPEQQLARARQVREVAAEVGREVAILADLRGPKIRIEDFTNGSVTLDPGDRFILDAGKDPEPGTGAGVGVSYKNLPDDVRPGDVLLLDDGLISMRVEKIQGRKVICEVDNGGVLRDRKGINLQGGGLSVPGIAEHDVRDIPRAAAMDADYLAVSFPRNAEDMNEAGRLLRQAGSAARLVAKIERAEAVAHLEEIVAASHAVLVARGDLGVEIGDAELPGLQKRIIRSALDRNRIVITATQMMQSMIENPIPTRAEVLDVANAVIDGTDAVMLSAETAVGKHPVKVIEAMDRVCLGAERHCDTRDEIRPLNVHFQRIDQAIAMAAMFMATNVHVDAIVALTESGSTAQWLSRVRSNVPIYALSPLEASRRRMALYRGVYPVAHVQSWSDVNRAVEEAILSLTGQGRLQPGNRVILTTGDRVGNMGGTNTLRLVQVGKRGAVEHQAELDLR